jgi:F-type H+-transporting ATPase subunit b
MLNRVAFALTVLLAAPARASEDVGMPQLDSTFFPSQLFWLFVTGMFLYVVLSKFALPVVGRMVELRDAKVREDLEAAYALKQQAEDIKINYTKSLRDADERAHTLVGTLTAELKAKQAEAIAKSNAVLQSKISDTERHLRAEKEAIGREAPEISKRLAKTILAELSKEAA